MLFALALALIAIAGGAVVTYLFDEDAPVPARLCMGACIGFAALGLVGFILASLFGFTPYILISTAAVVASPLALLTRPERRVQVRADVHEAIRGVRRAVLHPTRQTTAYIVFYAFVALVLWLVFERAMVELPDGIYTGVQNNYGDLPFHLSIITSFTDGANFPPEDPTFAGARFTYPFLADFVAACFVRAGATLRQAMLLENFVLALSFVGLLNRFALKLTRDWIAGLIAPVLVLFSGGLGWWHLFKDARWGKQSVFDILFNLQQQYTITPDTGYRWGNSLTTLLIPQRGILLGFPLAVIVFTIWWTSLENSEEGKRQKIKGKRKAESHSKLKVASASLSPFSFFLLPSVRRMALAGAIAGLLPLVHAHSFVVVMVVGCGVALFTGLKDWRAWAAFFIVATLTALPQMWWATHGSSVRAGDFFGWNFGWDRGEENVFRFWFKNTGLLIPLIFAALLWRERKSAGRKYLVSRRLLLFYLPFTLCFIIPNLIKLAPWVWDNIKVIYYWFIASVPLVALLLARLMRGRWWLRVAAVALLLTLTLAGALDVWSVASRAAEFRIFDADGVRFAEIVKRQTPERATILHEPTFDTPIFLTGRRSLMGYPGHISSHGIEYQERLGEIRRIYAGAPDAESLLAKYNVEYVVAGPHEQREMPVNEAFFKRYRLVGETGEYRLYKIAPP
ncbi:MAG: hypothetical protein QOH25_2164 [Acidobacteriota bacterium]|jgi:hypothetical protein|nr:hypothetical protein [Acidobacteriota bacterium]